MKSQGFELHFWDDAAELKVVIIGDSGAGTACILACTMTGTYRAGVTPTIATT
jgi:hypothetical protein